MITATTGSGNVTYQLVRGEFERLPVLLCTSGGSWHGDDSADRRASGDCLVMLFLVLLNIRLISAVDVTASLPVILPDGHL